MDAWAADQKIEGSMLTFLADPRSEVTQELGMILDHPGPISKLGYNRSKRFAMYIDNGTIKAVKVAEGGPMGEEDPAGDDFPEESLIEAMIRGECPLELLSMLLIPRRVPCRYKRIASV